MTRHPADETLAAFADGRLNVHAREEMIEHLAACDDCRSIYDVIADAQEAEVIPRPAAPAPTPVVHGNFGKVIGTLAAAAAVTVVFFTPPVQDKVAEWRTGGVSKLVEASEGLMERPIAGRLAGFHHNPFAVERGDKEKAEIANYLLQAEAAAVLESSDGASVKDLRAKGLAHLMLGQYDKSVESLERASKIAGGNDPLILNDLAAAQLERARFSGKDVKVNLETARETVVRAWTLKKTPEIAWNRAYILYYADDPGAQAAWNDYLALDSSSPWADEARGYLGSDL